MVAWPLFSKTLAHCKSPWAVVTGPVFTEPLRDRAVSWVLGHHGRPWNSAPGVLISGKSYVLKEGGPSLGPGDGSHSSKPVMASLLLLLLMVSGTGRWLISDQSVVSVHLLVCVGGCLENFHLYKNPWGKKICPFFAFTNVVRMWFLEVLQASRTQVGYLVLKCRCIGEDRLQLRKQYSPLKVPRAAEPTWNRLYPPSWETG